MIDILTLLRATPAVDGFRVVTTRSESYELFFVHRSLETVRATDTTTVEVTVYVNHDGKLGDSTFQLTPAMDEADAAARIEAAVRRARLVFNEPYPLPEGGCEEVTLPTNFDALPMHELAAQVADAVFAADCHEGGSINATEIFLYRDCKRVQNSRGIDKTQTVCHGMIEAIPTWNAGAESVELYEQYRFATFDAETITAEIGRRMREVRDRQSAAKPQTPMTCSVVLNPDEICDLFGEIVDQMDYSAIYSHANLYSEGDQLQPNRSGDPLTLSLVGEIPGSVYSAAFDSDGVALRDCTVVRDGEVCGSFGSHRFACYLGKEPTGALRCVKAEPGTLTDDELRAAPYLEAVSLSGLQVDLYNDYIGGEIRLAYYFDGTTTVPVTGISMSGKVSDVLSSLRMSAKTYSGNRYTGPEKLLLKGMNVL